MLWRRARVLQGLLEYLEDDGQSIEPKFYVPVLPLVLINGAEGIGTGWSSSVPNYNPRDVVANIKKMMGGDEPEAMTPWYRGFSGSIVPQDVKNTSFTTYGSVAKLDDATVHISELPIRKWTQDYKDSVLEPMLNGDKDKDGKTVGKAFVDDVREHHTDTTVSFSVRFAGGAAVMQDLESKGALHKTLKLSSSISTTNMTLFDERGRIVRHETPEAILSTFYQIRLEFYEKRKRHLADVLTKEWTKLDNRVRFVLAVISGALKINNVKKDVLIATLHKEGYATFEPPAKKKSDDKDDDDDDEAVDVDAKQAAKGPTAKGYDYLLGMPLWSLTLEKVTQLQGELQAKDAELQTLLNTSPKQLWAADLDAFLVGYDEWEAQLTAAEKSVPVAKGGKGKAPAKKASKKKAADSDDDDDDDDFMDDSDDDWGAKKKKKAPPKKAAAKADAPPPPPNTANAVLIAIPNVPLKRKMPKDSDLESASEADSIAPSAPAPAKAKPAGKAKAPPVATVIVHRGEGL